MAIQPTQPQGIGGVLDTAFQLYKSSFGAVWPISLLMAAVNVVPILFLVFGLSSLDPSALATNPLAMYGEPTMLIVAVLCGLLGLWIASALFLKQRAIGGDEAMTTGDALQAASRRVLTMFVAGILFGVAVVVGLILLVVPGLILMVSLILYMTLALFEDKGPVDSLVGSHKLVWGNWWRTCGVLTVMGILLFVILFAVGFIMALVIPFAGIALADAFVVGMIVQAVSNAAFYLFLGPLGTAMLIALYWDLKLRKEGGDLAARVNALSAA